MWALLRRLHFYAGVFVAPFLVIAALTGLAYAFTPQLDQLAYGPQLRVDRVGAAPRPLAEQVAAARAAHPEGTIAAVAVAEDPAATTRVSLSVPELGEEHQRTVFVDPYTSQVRGALTTWFGTGAATAVGRRCPTSRRGVRRTRSWHASTALWLLLGLLFISATGLTWSRFAGANFTTALAAAGAEAPEIDATLAARAGAALGGQESHHDMAPDAPAAGLPAGVGIDGVAASARAAGLTGPLDISPPADEASGWVVAQTDNRWPVRLDQVAVDPASGAITATSPWADYPVLAKLSTLGIQAHMGVLFGLPDQLLLAALAVGLLTVIVWGYRSWWQRRPTRDDRRRPLGRPPARGAWRGLPIAGLAAGAVAVWWRWAGRCRCSASRWRGSWRSTPP